MRALGLDGCPPVGRLALIGETLSDVRDVMIEGASGLLSVHRKDECPTWRSSCRQLVWPNGAIGHVFSSEDPESLRGPQFEIAWADELCKWRYVEETWNMLQFSLRLGSLPRQMVTTTPKPLPLLRRLIKDPQTALTHARTEKNARNLAPSFLGAVVGRYEGTFLGRQELDGELIEEQEGALWTLKIIERCRVQNPPPLVRVVVAIDPPISSGKRSDSCGIIAAGTDEKGCVFVLEDASLIRASPSIWAEKALALYHRLQADTLVVEVNQGGDLVKSLIENLDRTVPIVPVYATRGKYLRAEPVAVLYEQGRVRHVGAFSNLEDEMISFSLKGLPTGKSPDRLDALVWAVTFLALRRNEEPRIRFF
jgi:phage terminase large subunit-like protein